MKIKDHLNPAKIKIRDELDMSTKFGQSCNTTKNVRYPENATLKMSRTYAQLLAVEQS